MNLEILSISDKKSDDNILTLTCTTNIQNELEDLFKRALVLDTEIIMAERTYFKKEGQDFVTIKIELTNIDDLDRAKILLMEIYDHFQKFTVQVN